MLHRRIEFMFKGMRYAEDEDQNAPAGWAKTRLELRCQSIDTTSTRRWSFRAVCVRSQEQEWLGDDHLAASDLDGFNGYGDDQMWQGFGDDLIGNGKVFQGNVLCHQRSPLCCCC